jgi:transcriptional regulator with XRE-family HTH domain
MDSPELLDRPKEIGRRIGAACGYAVDKKLGEIAEELGVSDTTLRSYTQGNLGQYSPRDRRRTLIEEVERITGCPPDVFGLSEPEPKEVDQLRRIVAEQAKAQTRLSEELVKVQKAQAESRSRIERLERGGEGTGT